MKRCYHCKQTKSLECFSKNRYRPDGLATACRPCRTVINGKYVKLNPEKAKARSVKFLKANPGYIALKLREYRATVPKYREYDRCSSFKKRYGSQWEEAMKLSKTIKEERKLIGGIK